MVYHHGESPGLTMKWAPPIKLGLPNLREGEAWLTPQRGDACSGTPKSVPAAPTSHLEVKPFWLRGRFSDWLGRNFLNF